MFNRYLMIFPLLFVLTGCSNAGEEAKANMQAIAQKSSELLRVEKVDELRETPIPGLFEVRSGRNIYYSDASGEHFVLGANIIETSTKRNLTRERKEEVNRIDWSTLPLDKAILSGERKSQLKLAIFTDPDCPYCRTLEKELKQLKGVAVYTFLMPIKQLHPHAHAKSEAIWCSKDQHKMLQKVMLEKFTPEKANCVTPIDDIIALAKKLNITGTPTLIAGDGRIASGGKSATAIKSWLSKKQDNRK